MDVDSGDRPTAKQQFTKSATILGKTATLSSDNRPTSSKAAKSKNKRFLISIDSCKIRKTPIFFIRCRGMSKPHTSRDWTCPIILKRIVENSDLLRRTPSEAKV